MVVAQLAERWLPTPETHCLNPDIGNEKFQMHIFQLLSRTDKNKEKEAGNGPLKKYYRSDESGFNFFATNRRNCKKFCKKINWIHLMA